MAIIIIVDFVVAYLLRYLDYLQGVLLLAYLLLLYVCDNGIYTVTCAFMLQVARGSSRYSGDEHADEYRKFASVFSDHTS